VASRVQFLGTPPTDAKGKNASVDGGLVAESEEPFLELRTGRTKNFPPMVPRD
jgi:hypothetical protein